MAGDIADDMLDGVLCCQCGAVIEYERMIEAGATIEGTAINVTPGYPVPCEWCVPDWKPGDDPWEGQ